MLLITRRTVSHFVSVNLLELKWVKFHKVLNEIPIERYVAKVISEKRKLKHFLRIIT